MATSVMTTLRTGFSINTPSVDEAIAGAKEAEHLGFDRLGVWDSPTLYREPWVTLGPIAMSTSKLRIGPWVTNPLTRHPAVTAAAAATLDDLAPGRVILGIGTGDSGVYNLGAAASPLQTLTAYIETVRSLLTAGEGQWEGSPIRMPWAAGRKVPIFAAAHGTRSLRKLAGVADGLIVGLGVHPDVVLACREIISEAATEAEKSPGDIETWWLAPWYVNDSPGRAHVDALWRVAALVHHWARTNGSGKLLPPELRDRILELGRRYDMSTHGMPSPKQKEEYASYARDLGVADYLVSRFTFSGTPEDVSDQVRTSYAAGATNLDATSFVQAGSLTAGARLWSEQVAPRISDLTKGGPNDE